MKNLLVFIILISVLSCKTETPQKLKTGFYRTTLNVTDSLQLPFIMEVISENKLKIFNAEEVIDVDEITYRNDSVFINLPVYEGYLAAIFEDDNLKGSYIKEGLNRIVPFEAIYGNANRFVVNEQKTKYNISGNWETIFSPNSEDDTYIAKGIFKQEGNKVAGTFRTTTGDYRYLEGVINGNKMQLSTFDGAHAFLFTATVAGSTMQGQFYSGNHWQEPFTAKRNEAYELPSANELTFIKEGYEKFEFSFPDAESNVVSLKDERFKNKVVLVQIMGTWCPNCLDESKYYSEFYKNNKAKDIEIVALAFEYSKTKEKAFKNIKRLKERIGITYPILLAQFGSSSKVKAQEKLPMLNHVLSYPTTIFIDKKGNVRKIHTGFNGPATGEKYAEFKVEFTSFVDELLAE